VRQIFRSLVNRGNVALRSESVRATVLGCGQQPFHRTCRDHELAGQAADCHSGHLVNRVVAIRFREYRSIVDYKHDFPHLQT
jgi:hypothetical protein